MGFRKRESNQEGFGIQRNEKMKAGGKMYNKPKKKPKKKAVAKKQGELTNVGKSDAPIKSKVELKIEDLQAQGKNIPPGLLRKLDRFNAGMKVLTGEALTDAEEASKYRPRRSSRIMEAALGKDDITMINQQDQGQTATGGSAVATGGSANASAEANPNINVNATANPFMVVDTDTAVDVPISIQGYPRGAVIDTPEGPMLVDPLTGVLMPVNPGTITNPENMPNMGELPGGFYDEYGMPLVPLSNMMNGGMVVPSLVADNSRRVITEEGEFIVSPNGEFIPIENRGRVGTRPQGSLGDGGMKYQGLVMDERSGMMLDNNRGIAMDPSTGRIIRFDTNVGLTQGMFENGGYKYQGVEKGITKGGKEQFKAGGKKKRKAMKKGKSNRYGY